MDKPPATSSQVARNLSAEEIHATFYEPWCPKCERPCDGRICHASCRVDPLPPLLERMDLLPEGLECREACDGCAWWLALPLSGDPDCPHELISDDHAALMLTGSLAGMLAKECADVKANSNPWDLIAALASGDLRQLAALGHRLKDAQEQSDG